MSKEKNEKTDEITKPSIDYIIVDKEFLKFAKEITKIHAPLKDGFYVSKNSNYCVKIGAPDNDSFNTFKGARVSRETGLIQLDNTFIQNENVSANFIYFLMIWCYISRLMPHEDISYVDSYAYAYTRKEGGTTGEILRGLEELISTSENPKKASKRYETMFNFCSL